MTDEDEITTGIEYTLECDDLPEDDNPPEEEETEIYVSHTIITKSGEVFYAHESLELVENTPNGEVEVVVAVDALNYPEKGDRSIIIIPKANIDYTQEFYYKDNWDTLMESAVCSQCEQIARYSSGAHGIYQ